jgi:glycosyltransferase involved in cell wall biosynthesis
MSSRLRIAQIAPLWTTVPPNKAGGIERIIASLCNLLTERGHEVTLFAATGSNTKARLVPGYPKTLLEAGIGWDDNLWTIRNIKAAYERAHKGEFDILHNHTDMWGFFFAANEPTPTLHTSHNRVIPTPLPGTGESLERGRYKLYEAYREQLNFAFISESARTQTQLHFPKSQVVYNGIDLSPFKLNEQNDDYFAWVARLDDYKGAEQAIAACERLGVRLKMAGPIDPSKRGYFRDRIEPHLSDRIEHLGELTSQELSRLYGGAQALLFPISWEEPFGLVVVEAMACGTPVIAYKRGSMPELIQDGINGFVIESDLDVLIQTMQRVKDISRPACRASVEKNFSEERMVEAYEKYYYDILAK